MHKKIKAIETEYGGCRFRSRLEARWAVFLDELEIEWRYEVDGFETPAGRYLPDFYLPQQQRWIEIKGGSFTKRDRERAAHFAEYCWQNGEGFRVLLGDVPRTVTKTFGIPAMTWTMVIWPMDLLNEQNMSPPVLVRAGEVAIAGTPEQFAAAERFVGQTLPDTAVARRKDGGHEYRFYRNSMPDRLEGRRELRFGLQILHPGEPLPWLVFPEREPLSTRPGEHLEYGECRDFQQSRWIPPADPDKVDAALTAARSARFEFGETGR